MLLVLTTGVPWERLQQEFGFGSGISNWRRRMRR
ncbi:hypothetical protein DXT74_13345 [Chromobacterium sp. Rain0013]|nr:hypothetical protein DXT74_13345 [Chromobacterium sp. Rain0013]